MKLKRWLVSVCSGILLLGPLVAASQAIDIDKIFDAPKGTQPSGLAWAGGYLWMSSYKLNPGIYKINPADGAVIEFISPNIVWDNRYGGLAADRFSIFHLQANNGNNFAIIDGNNSKVEQERVLRCKATNFSDPAILNGSLWVIGNNNALNPDDYTLYRFSSAGDLLASYKWAQGLFRVQNFGMTSDGSFLWVSAGQQLVKVDPSDGRIVRTYDLPFERIESLAWDGKAIWAASFRGGIYKIIF